MGIEVFPIPASGPSLAEITSAITSNAAPATVTMPAITSSITTNAASSGVTMAAITSSITTNAASSGVTLAAIGTQVANNASPYGGTWANVATTSASTVSTITVSGLTGYKFLKIFCVLENVTASYMRYRLNGDTGSNYNYWTFTSAAGTDIGRTADTSIVARRDDVGSGGFVFDIPLANGTGHNKYIEETGGRGGSQIIGRGVWNSTAAVSSFTLFIGSGTFDTYIRVWGAN
jgi:hypothetical protein